MSSLETIQHMLMKEFSLSREAVSPEQTLEQLGIDSLSALEFMFEIEDHFHLKIKGEMGEMRTVGDIAAAVDRILGESSSANS